MPYIQISQVGVWNGMSRNESYVMMLTVCDDSERSLPILVGPMEAQSLLVARDGVQHQRPTTHDLMLSSLEAFGLTLKEVRIERVVDGVFYANIVLTDSFNDKVVDCRASDGVVLALLTGCTLLADSKLVEEVGCDINSLVHNLPRSKGAEEECLPVDELQRQLDEAVANEDYERAAYLQELIDARLDDDDKQ